VKPLLKFSTVSLLAFAGQIAVAQQASAPATPAAPPPQTQTQKNVEAFLRNFYAFGPDTKVVVGTAKDSPVEGLQEIDITVIVGENKENAKFYVSKDGKFLFRGELSDMTKDPFAETRKQLPTEGAPVLGDPKAAVTLVEFSDFQCPVCRNLHDVLRGLLPNYVGKVRVVFKDFPIEQLHPWARTAAIAGHCAYQQNPDKFWTVYDLIYDNQELISAENAWVKMGDFADQAGLHHDTFKSCMISPESAAAITASHEAGKKLEVGSTPTVFVNGRRLVGADAHLLEQYIKYELEHVKPVPGEGK
jgi:protein-disulfide isomerase